MASDAAELSFKLQPAVSKCLVTVLIFALFVSTGPLSECLFLQLGLCI